MNKNDKIFVENWTKTRAKGKWRFNFMFGSFLGFGGAIGSFFFSNQYQTISSFFSLHFLMRLIITIGISVFIVAPILWWIYENRYKKLTQSN